MKPHTSESQHDSPWLRGLVDALPGAIYRGRVDPARTVHFVSEGCRALFGCDPETMMRSPPEGGLARYMYPEDAVLAHRLVQDALATGEPFELTYRSRRAGGPHLWLLERGRVIPARDGEDAIVEGFVTDVSAVQAARSQVAERERVVTAIFEQTYHFIGLLDRDGRVLRANRSSLVAVGVRAEEVIGRPFWDTVWWQHDPEQQETLRQAIKRAAGGESVRLDVEHRRPDGTSVYVDFSLSPVRDERGQVVALIPEGHDITERRAMESALRESEEKLARAFAASPDAITITDLATGLLMDVNQGFEQLFEWPRSEALGRSTLELRLWANEHDRTRLIQILARDGRVRDFIALGRARSGRLAQCTIAGELVEIAGERAIILVIRDVTEQIRAEQALRESEERMRLLIENAPDAIVVLDATAGVLTEVNAEALALFRASRAQLLGQALAALTPERQPDGRVSAELLRHHVMSAVSGGRPSFEWLARSLDGREVPCEVRLIRLPSPDAVLIRGSITDLSERKRAEQAFRALLEGTAGVGGQQFFDTTVARLARELEARVVVVAEVQAKPHGLWLRCLARWVEGPVAPVERDVSGTIIEPILREGTYRAELGLLRRCPEDPVVAELRADSLIAMPVRDRTGVVLGAVLVADDKPMADSDAARLLVAVSAERAAVEIQHRRAEEAIHRLNTDLERRVAERTVQLAAANAELESFSYSVSHDLRSPLRAIDGFSRALEEDCAEGLPPDGRDFLRRIRAASQRMGMLIDDLLRLSRAARVEMHPEPVDLSAIAAGVIAELRQRDATRDVEFVAEPGLTVVADRALVGILLQNLLDNAWKYTRRISGAQIRFGRAPMAPASGESAVFVISDNGAGFDMRYVNKLFAPFQRLHGPSDFEGTGIGLATVRRIVVRHGGRVWIQGAVGQGASVYFTFGDAQA